MRHLITATLTAIECLGIAIPRVGAQTAKDLAGTWTLESDASTTADVRTIQPFGPQASGIAIFDSAGHFAIINSRPDLPKFASKNRMRDRAEENEAIVRGSFAFFGTYSVANGVIVQHIEGGTCQPGPEPTRNELSLLFPGTSRHGLQFLHSAAEVNFIGNA